MGRSIRSAKSAGTQFETAVCRYFTDILGIEVKRMPKQGSKDRGDVADLCVHGRPLTVECKNPGKNSKFPLPTWWGETEVECENNHTDLGVLLIRKFGTSDTGKSWAVVSHRMFAALSGGNVPLVTHNKAVPKKDWGIFEDGLVHCWPRPKFTDSPDDWWVTCPLDVFRTAVEITHEKS